MRDRYNKIHKVMVLQNLNFKEAEKKFSIPEFNYNPGDFPALINKPVIPTIQERVNSIISSNYPISSLINVRKTPRRTNIKSYTPLPTVQNVIHGMELDGPVFNESIYLAGRVSEYERVMSEILTKSNAALGSEETDAIASLLQEIALIAKKTQESNDNTLSGAGNNISSASFTE